MADTREAAHAWASVSDDGDPRYVIVTTRTGHNYRVPKEPLRFPGRDDD